MVSSGIDGMTQNLDPNIPPAPYAVPPLEVTVYDLKIRVAVGTIAGVIPKIGSTSIDTIPAPTITATGTGPKYLIASITGTWVLTPDGLFVKQLTNREVVISYTSTVPTLENQLSVASPGPFKFILAFFVDNKLTLQNGYGPITCYFEDDASSTAKLDMTVIYPGSA